MKSSVSHPAARRTRDLQVWGLSGRVFVPAKIRDLSRCPDGLYHLPPPGVSDFQTIYWIRRVRRMITSYLLMKNLTSPTPIWHHKSSLTVSNPLSLFFQWEHTLQIETASVNIHSRLTSHYPDRYHVWLTDFNRRFLFSCCETDSCEKLLAASPAASLKRSTNSDPVLSSSVSDVQWISGGIFQSTFAISFLMNPLSLDVAFLLLLQL